MEYKTLDSDTKRQVIEGQINSLESEHYATNLRLESAPDVDTDATKQRLKVIEAGIGKLTDELGKLDGPAS